MNECYLQVVYYFINFQLADTQFPLVCKIGKGIKIERKMGEIGLPLWPPFFFWAVMRTSAKTRSFSREIKELPQISQF